jgi:signal transduction histidine kinase
MALEQFLRSQSKAYLLMVMLGCLLVVGFLDYITGYEVSLFIFYAVPIVFAVWFLDRKWTALIVLMSAVVWWWADWKSGHRYSADWLEIWETIVRLSFFIMVALGGIAFKSRRDSLMESVANMRRMRELEREVVAASERERHRIGADLHDGLCQHLAGITCLTISLEEDLKEQCPGMAGMAGEIDELLQDAIVQARNIARGIAPVQMDDEGLFFALDELAANTRRIHEIECVLESAGGSRTVDCEVATHLYRIAQEAISNAVRHGHATVIAIRLTVEQRQVALSVEDNGIGIPAEPAGSTGMGLRTMRYRAEAVNGTIEIENMPEGGARVRCNAPLPAGAEREPVHHGT